MMQDRKTIAISEIVKIIEECRYDDEIAEKSIGATGFEPAT